jgi:hypothetical protein
MIGQDGQPIICPNGEPIRIDPGVQGKRPSLRDARDAQRDLPEGKGAVYNRYAGEFEAVDAVTDLEKYGDVIVSEQLVYKCGPDNEPVLVPLSEMDPQAAEGAHRQVARQLRNSDESTGLGEPAASVVRSSSASH